jgi:hypothetical protein
MQVEQASPLQKLYAMGKTSLRACLDKPYQGMAQLATGLGSPEGTLIDFGSD